MPATTSSTPASGRLRFRQSGVVIAALAVLVGAVLVLVSGPRESRSRGVVRTVQVGPKPATAAKKPTPPSEPAAVATEKPLVLFDGKTLDGWKATKFGGEGQVATREGQLVLEMGVDLTGITWQNKDVLPKSNYEVSLDAMRVDGNDFFCGLTFPVKDDPCSLIVGGWGGGVCGLSSLNGMDASENETTTYQTFEKGRWYHIRLRVTDTHISAWIDKKEIVDQDITGREISIRSEVDLSRPFGISSWQTTAALKNIEIRKLSDADLKQDAQARAAAEKAKDEAIRREIQND